MLDNGAFTFWRQKKPTDWDKFYAWADIWLDYPATWAVIPDVIDGTEEENDELIRQWPFGEKGVPVWHLNEGFDRLLRLADSHDLICFGSSGMYSQVGSPEWHFRTYQALIY
jgi:hypothetical protein